jgi:serine/threonine-protein kinase HipA
VSELFVYLDGVRSGVVEESSGGNLSFRYDPDYRALPDPTPLSLSMPLAAAQHRKRAIWPYLQGLLPDNETALAS